MNDKTLKAILIGGTVSVAVYFLFKYLKETPNQVVQSVQSKIRKALF